MILCKGADIDDRRSIGKRRFKFDCSEVHRPHELAHFALSSLPGSLLQARNVVDSSAFTRIDVSEISGVQQNELGPKFIRERNRVAKAFSAATVRDSGSVGPYARRRKYISMQME